MDEEERKRKLDAGKAKLESFRRKRKKHKNSKKDKNSEPTTSSGGNSTAVQTGDDDTSLHISDTTDDLSTTAEEISTDEEQNMVMLSPRERMQELELTISDQQVALQKLTLENKTLREHEVEMKQVIDERDSVINSLQTNVEMTAQHVKQLQANLSQATEAVQTSGTEQGEVLSELLKARTELSKFQAELTQQEEAMHEVAKKLEEKSMEAAEAQESIKSLMMELEKSQSVTQDSMESVITDKEINSLRVEMDTQHEKKLAVLRKQHEDALKIIQHRDEEISRLQSGDSMNTSDVQVLQEQLNILSLQLEASYKDADKARKKHDQEVVKLNQQLINTIDEYETKLKKEHDSVVELEEKLDMCDAVNSEIQSSFTERMSQLEEERDNLKAQILEEGHRTKENAVLNNLIQDLRDEVETYKEDVKATEKQLEDTSVQKRKLTDEVNNMQKRLKNEAEILSKLNNKLAQSESEITNLTEKLNQKESEMENILQRNEEDLQQIKIEYEDKLSSALKEQNHFLQQKHTEVNEKLRNNLEEEMVKAKKEHSNELKMLQTQHVQEMDKMRDQMEEQLRGMRESLESERKLQLNTVKDVTEKSRLREIENLKENYENDIKLLKEEHSNMIDVINTQYEEDKLSSENELTQKLQAEFEIQIASMRSEAQENLIKTVENLKQDLKMQNEKENKSEMENFTINIKNKYESMLSDEKKTFQDQLQKKIDEYDNCVKKYEEEKAHLITEHENTLNSLKTAHNSEMEKRKEETQRLLDEAKQEHEAAIELVKTEAEVRNATEKHVQEQVEKLQQQLSEGTSKLDAEYKISLSNMQEEQGKIQEELQEEIKELKLSLQNVEKERDDIAAQADESRKRLETLHHDEMRSLQLQLNEAITTHQNRIKQMQLDIESARSSRSELQDLKDQILARNENVEEMELMRAQFQLEQTNLQANYERQMQELRDETTMLMEQTRNEVPEEIREEMVQLRHQVEEYKEKLSSAEMTLATIRDASSPGRPISAISDYDTSNLDVLNKDYRDAMTLTHISDVSGMGEIEEGALNITADEDAIQEEVEEEEVHSIEEGELLEDLSMEKSDAEKTTQNNTLDASKQDDALSGQVLLLQQKIEELEAEYEKLICNHKQEMSALEEKHKAELETSQSEARKHLEEEINRLKLNHEEELNALNTENEDKLRDVEDERLKAIAQIRLQCASETATQIEEELEKLKSSHTEELDSLKHKLDVEFTEKMEQKERDHTQELEELTDRHSVSMEERLAAVMQELYNQKQESAKEVDDQHKKKIEQLEQDKIEAEKILIAEWEEKYEALTAEKNNVTEKMIKLEAEYNSLKNNLESGDIDEIRRLKQQHEEYVINLKNEFDLKESEFQAALENESNQFQQAQEEYIEQHQKQLDNYIADHQDEIKSLLKEKEELVAKLKSDHRIQIDELERKLKDSLQQSESEQINQIQEEKNQLLEAHNEELKVVALKLVEVTKEKDDLLVAKKQIETQIESLVTEHQEALSSLKSSLIAQHMEKFQVTIGELDQHHLSEMEKLREESDQQTAEYKKVAEDAIAKLRLMEEDNSSKIQEMMKESNERMERMQGEHEESINAIKQQHTSDIAAVKEQHAQQMEMIEKEILSNEESHKNDLENVLQTQTMQLDEIKKQFDVVLKSAKASSEDKVQELNETISRLEEQLSNAEKDVQVSNTALEEQQNKFIEFEKKLEEVKATYEEKLAKVSASLEQSYEDLKDLNARVEFERAEYEAEIDQLQTELKSKEKMEEELRNEISEKSTGLKKISAEFENVANSKERETQEEDNLIKMLRDDLDKNAQENEQLKQINERLLSSLSDLVNANNKCEETIARHMRTTMGDKSGDSTPRSPPDEALDGKLASSKGSFVDEGLDVSQRLSESLFAGPDFDTSAMDVVVESSQRVAQAVSRLLDEIERNAKQLNVANQGQLYIGNDLDKTRKKSEEDDNLSKEELIDQIEKMEKVIESTVAHNTDLETRIQQYENAESEMEARFEELRKRLEEHLKDEERLKEEQNILAKEKEAFASNTDETHQNLLKLVEEISAEKQVLSEQFQDAKSMYDLNVQQLEATLEEAVQQLEDRDNNFATEREDLLQQIQSLQKQATSQTKFSDEQLSERETERDHFEEELAKLQEELEKNQEASKSGSKYSQEISHLEEELANKEQSYQEKLEKIKNDEQLLKSQLKEQEETLTLEQKECEQLRNELDSMTLEREVLQKELNDAIVKVASLQCKIDEYKHGKDPTAEGLVNGGSGDHSRTIQRLELNLEQGREALEAKDNEIEHLVEIHSQLRSEILEKEEQIQSLISEADNAKDVEAENFKLKKEMEKLNKTLSSDPATTTEQLSALSQNLIEEKNSEIDELTQKLADMTKDIAEIDKLKQEVSELNTRLQENKTLPEGDDSFFTAQEPETRIRELSEENNKLKIQIDELMGKVTEGSIILPHGVKEKIRDLEEQILKEVDTTQLDSGTIDVDDLDKEEVDDVENEKNNLIKETLDEITMELKELPNSVIGRILRNQDEYATTKDDVISNLEETILHQNEKLSDLENEICGLKKELEEADVSIQMNDNFKEQNDLPVFNKIESDSSTSSGGTESLEVESPPLTPEPNVASLNLIIKKKDEEICRQAEVIQQQSNALTEQESAKESIASELQSSVIKCEEMQIELEKRLNEINHESTLPIDELSPQQLIEHENVRNVIQQATQHLEGSISAKEEELAMAKEEKERLSSDLRDVQREYMALLKESDDFQDAAEVQSQLESKVNELEELLQDREQELQQSQQDYDALLNEKDILSEDLRTLQEKSEASQSSDGEYALQQELSQLRKKLKEKESEIEELGINIQNLNQQLEDKSKSANEDIELLQNEQQILASENATLLTTLEDFQHENDKIKQKYEESETELKNKLESINKQYEEEKQQLQGEISSLKNAAVPIEPIIAQESMQTSAAKASDFNHEELLQQHEAAIRKLKEEHSSDIAKAIEEVRDQLSLQHISEMNDIKEHHRKEVAELLSESSNGESEIAQRLRTELDLAEKLDNRLVGHLSLEDGDNEDVSDKLQDLLDRVHKEGIEVLSLSELQFIRQQQQKHASTTTPIKTRKMHAQREQAWEQEKAALINALQAMKQLLTHANEQPDDEHQWRDDMMKILSDFFNKERDGLLAELRTSVTEAQNSIQQQIDILPQDTVTQALEKLEKLQQKIADQSLSHQEVIEKMNSTDRDALFDEIHKLQNDRQTAMENTAEQVKNLEEKLLAKSNELNNATYDTQSKISQLQSKLQQEQALLEDVTASLEAEKKRSNEQLVPALERERNTVVELEANVGDLQNKLAEEAGTSHARSQKLITELEDNRVHMDNLQDEITSLRKKLEIANHEIEAMHQDNDETQEQAQNEINDLRDRLQTAETLHTRAVAAIDLEKNNASKLRDELAQERNQYLKESAEEKARMQGLNAEVENNKMRHDHVVGLLNREKDQVEKLNKILESQQKEDARKKDKINELQKLLGKSKQEVDVVQQRYGALKAEAKTTQQLYEAKCKEYEHEIKSVEADRAELEATVNDLQQQKQETERKLDDLERDVMHLQAKSNEPRLSPQEMEELLAHRRHLEAIRQRLQLEGTKLQDLIARTACHVPYGYPLDNSTSPRDQLDSDSEQVDSIKRTLGGMQQELRDLYTDMTTDNNNQIPTSIPTTLTDRLLQQNAELAQVVTSASDEKTALRDTIRKLENDLWNAKHEQPTSVPELEIKNKQQQIQEMANRMHRLYTRYMRAESFRKALVYQKKYMLLLIGGFQDCEDTTLAVIAKMGAFPSKDATAIRSRHSRGFTRFRSAVRTVMAISRLKFLVRKWDRHSNSVSDAILSKHGTAPITNGRKTSQIVSPSSNQLRPTSGAYMHDRSPSPTPLPQRSYTNGYENGHTVSPIQFTPPVKLTNATPSSRRSGVIPETTIPDGNTYRSNYPNYNNMRPIHDSLPTYQPNYTHSSYNRSMDRPAESDPSLNAYIQRLENLQHRLHQDRHIYPR